MSGCQYVGAGADLKDHLSRCSFDEQNKKIPCQDITCNEEVAMGEMVQHLKGVHGSLENVADSSGKMMRVARFARSDNVNYAYWAPQTCSYNNQTFFLHADNWDKVWTFWVAILGNEGEARKYEVEMSIPKKEGCNFYMGFKGKVFSSDEDVGNVVRDRDNVLRLENNLAEVNPDGSFEFKLDYRIICL